METSPTSGTQVSFDHVAKERLALGKNGDVYLCLADTVGSGLYKFMGGEWYLVKALASPSPEWEGGTGSW